VEGYGGNELSMSRQEEESLESKLKRLSQKDEEVARALGRPTRHCPTLLAAVKFSMLFFLPFIRYSSVLLHC
jgi:hypothetical protein